MGHGTKRGIVDPAFSARISDLEAKANNMAAQFRNQNTYRMWHMPENAADPLDVPGLHTPAWDRNALNQRYSETILSGMGKQSGTVGDLIATKWQTDFMAAEERAFRTRHASYARCAALAHGRLRGHGATNGYGIFSFLRKSVETILAAGATSQTADTSQRKTV
jgi:hypothetical protein